MTIAHIEQGVEVSQVTFGLSRLAPLERLGCV